MLNTSSTHEIDLASLYEPLRRKLLTPLRSKDMEEYHAPTQKCEDKIQRSFSSLLESVSGLSSPNGWLDLGHVIIL